MRSLDTAGVAPGNLSRQLLVFLILFLFVGSSSAGARTLEGSISEAKPGEELSQPIGLAISPGDHLWVTDAQTEGAMVNKYSPLATWEAQTDDPPWGMASQIESIAYNEAAGLMFASQSHNELLWGLDPGDASYVGEQLDPLGEAPEGCCFIRVAADNSGGLSDGALYVFSSSGEIVRIDSSGNPLPFTEGSAAGTNRLTGDDTPQGFFAGPHGLSGAGLAVDLVGHLWVVDSPGPKAFLHEFSPTGRHIRTVSALSPLQGSGEGNAVAIDPTNGNVLVSDVAVNKVHEFSPSGVFQSDTTVTGGAILGVAVDSTGKLYVSGVGLPGDRKVGIFSAAGPPAQKHPLQIEVIGLGTVIGPDLNCSQGVNGTPFCEELFVSGSEVPMQVFPADGYALKEVSSVEGASASCFGSLGICETAALLQPTKLKVVFAPVPTTPDTPTPPPGPQPPEGTPAPPIGSDLRFVRIKRKPAKNQLVVFGKIAKEASGSVKVRLKAFPDGRRFAVQKRAPISDGRWRVTFGVPETMSKGGSTVFLTAQFSGSPGVLDGRRTLRINP